MKFGPHTYAGTQQPLPPLWAAINFYGNLERMMENLTTSELLLLLSVQVLLFFPLLYQRAMFFKDLIVYESFKLEFCFYVVK